MLARFANARLDWSEEGIRISMRHDYTSSHDRAHVTVTVETEEPTWHGDILVRFASHVRCVLACHLMHSSVRFGV